MPDPVTTVLLDGIWGRPRRFRALRELLHEHCGPTEVFHYACGGAVGFEELGARLADHIRGHDRAVNVIGFSMGGLVIRSAVLADPGLPIRRAVFLNAPLHGTWLAYALPLAGIRQMRPNSDFIRRVNAAPWTIPTLAVWCPLDLMVIPGRSSRLAGAQTIRCDVPLHIWPIHSPRIHRRIAAFLAADDSADLRQVAVAQVTDGR